MQKSLRVASCSSAIPVLSQGSIAHESAGIPTDPAQHAGASLRRNEQEGHVHRHDRSHRERQTHRPWLPGLRRSLRQSQRDQRIHQDRQRRVHRRQFGDRERPRQPGGQPDDERHHRRQRVRRLQRHGVRSDPDRRVRAQRQGHGDRSGGPDRRRHDRSRRHRRSVGPRRPGRHRAVGTRGQARRQHHHQCRGERPLAGVRRVARSGRPDHAGQVAGQQQVAGPRLRHALPGPVGDGRLSGRRGQPAGQRQPGQRRGRRIRTALYLGRINVQRQPDHRPGAPPSLRASRSRRPRRRTRPRSSILRASSWWPRSPTFPARVTGEANFKFRANKAANRLGRGNSIAADQGQPINICAITSDRHGVSRSTRRWAGP